MLHTVAGHGCSGITGMFRLCYRRSSRCARKVPDPRRRVMRVLVLSRGVPCASSPLRGVFELDQAKALATAGHDVLVGYVDGRSARRVRRFGWSHRTIDGIETLGLDLPLGAVSPELDHQAYRRATGLLHRRVVKLWGSPDVIHAHFSRHAAAVPDLVSTTCPWCTPNTSPGCPSMVPTDVLRRTYAVPSGGPMPSLPCRAHSRTSWTPGTEPHAAWSPMSSTSTSSRRPSRTRMRRFRPCQTLGRDQVHELPIWWQLGSSLNARG